MEDELVLCINPHCYQIFDPVGERNQCPLCDTLLGGNKCGGCDFLIEEEVFEGFKELSCDYNGLCPNYIG